MSEYVLRVIESAAPAWKRGSLTEKPDGLLVVGCDVDAYDGLGFAELTADVTKAKTFPNAAAAMAYWRRQSTVRPLRADGKPNRPLTAYTMECCTKEEACR